MKLRYGVKLASYRDQEMNLWVWEKDDLWSGSLEQAQAKLLEYEARNPDGNYIVTPLEA